MGWRSGWVGRRRARTVLLTAALALPAAVGVAPAGAFNIDFDPDTIPRLPCGTAGATRDVFCGTWLTDAPTGPMWTFASLGVVKLQRISEADARAREGTQFGDFAYTVRCSTGALFYAGDYGGGAGRVMACTNGTVLKGFYRSQTPENTGPGSSLRSGEFELTHDLGGAGDSDVAGTILQNFVGGTNWTGHCTEASCEATSVTPPAVPPGGAPGQPPINGPPLFRIVGLGLLPGTHRSGVDGVARTPQIGWLVGAKDRITVPGALNIGGRANITLQTIPGGAVFEVQGGVTQDAEGNNVAGTAVFEAAERPLLRQGEVTVTTDTVGARAHQLGAIELRTPVGRVAMGGGVATVGHDARRRVTTVGNVRGAVRVGRAGATRLTPLPPGRQVEISAAGISPPFALVPDLRTTIPSPRVVTAGPATVTSPSRISLRSLKRSKCVAVIVRSAEPARVLVTIFSGRRSTRLFGQRLLVFTAPARRTACIRVPAHAKTFDVRTPLRFAVGYALGARRRPGERATRPV
ncbi:MAG TPA: hypothetical protein VL422_18295, partial [Miltoncostaea sp.]|nr:hypothetical protein [Miltoncostaea sp.]